MTTIWVYPGQGAQRPGMLHELPETALTAGYLERASAALGYDVLRADGETALQSSEAVQICLFVAGVAGSAVLAERAGHPDYVAGLSVGAWAAAAVAGVLPFEDGVRLIARRGRLMQQAYPRGYGMTALIGADKSAVQRWVDEVCRPGNPVYLANVNAADQMVVAGSEAAMQAVAALAEAKGAAARRLAVSVPSHCALLDRQAAALEADMQNVPLSEPRIRYLSGTSARLLRNPQQIADDLVFNMCRTIDWEGTCRAAWERGVRLQIEMPPGSGLSGLARQNWPEGHILAVQNTRMDSLAAAMRREAEAV